ncbi:MAG: choice-of-anchor L domain-containing protein [Nitrospirota bacterium]
MRTVLKMALISVFIIASGIPAFAIGFEDLQDLTEITEQELTDKLMGSGGPQVSNIVYTGEPEAAGIFRNGLVDGIGIDEGILLTTGSIFNAVGPNDGAYGSANFLDGDTDLDGLVAPYMTADASVLEFDFIPPSNKNIATFSFVFASEEYNTFVGEEFNDIVALYVDGVNYALVPGTSNPVTINTLNGTATPAGFINNDPLDFGTPTPFGTQYNGFSKVISATVPIDPGAVHHVKIVIADTSDDGFDMDGDSAVFLAPVEFSENFPAAKIGVFGNAIWRLDSNGNGVFDPGTDFTSNRFGLASDVPVAGSWDGSAISRIGTFRSGKWFLDTNGNGIWNQGVDATIAFGIAGDIPVTGDWNNDGITDIGVFRGGKWYLDANGNRRWDQGVDSTFAFGLTGDKPITGDWNGSGTTKIGVVRGNTWFLDNGNGRWDAGIDSAFTFGLATDIPVAGDWNGDGITEIGVFRSGTWILDLNGNRILEDCTIDGCFTFGAAGDKPVIGIW